ncbi:CapA family protein [Candidatus Dojkabacteria bacterium]|nr:CapA family protein [Candidatus Dojkabacteria bacterium]
MSVNLLRSSENPSQTTSPTPYSVSSSISAPVAAQVSIFKNLSSKSDQDRVNPSVLAYEKSDERDAFVNKRYKFAQKFQFVNVFFLVLGGLLFIWGFASFYISKNNISLNPVLSKVFFLSNNKQNSDQDVTICIDSRVDNGVKPLVEEWVKEKNDRKYSVESFDNGSSFDLDSCDCIISAVDEDSLSKNNTFDKDVNFELVWKRYFVLMADYSTLLDNVSYSDFVKLVENGQSSIDNLEYSLDTDELAYDFVSRYFNADMSLEPEPQPFDLIATDQRKIVLVPFEKINSKYRSVLFDGVSIFDSDNIAKLDLQTNDDEGADTRIESEYSLYDGIWLYDKPDIGLYELILEYTGDVNYYPDQVVSVISTGTSVVGGRSLYLKVQENGDNLYPVREIAPVLQSADITHISNEDSFSASCVQYTWTMSFCGTIEAFDMLTFAGVDVVGLTGNHILDYGRDDFESTLDLYDQNGIQYFGGGRDFNDAHTPAVFDINGTTFAFLGYNQIPPYSYSADDGLSGSSYLDVNQMEIDIKSADEKYDYVFVDMQWGDEYVREPNYYQQTYGHNAIDFGADFVNGVHPHWIEPLEYYNDGMIFYSLGNLLFDQDWSTETREGLIVKHYFYDGKYLGFRVFPTMLFDEAQPRLVEGEDKKRIEGYLYSL